MKNNKEKDLAMYLTIFKIEGHETWRANLTGDKNGFSRYIATDPKFPKITEIKVFRVDRITGALKELEEGE